VNFRSRWVPGVLIGGIVLAGGGSVIAASGGSSSSGSSSKEQYCPPNSPGGGQPQGGPGNNCGNPPDKCPNGQPKPPGGNCGNNPGGPPEKPGKKHGARFHVKRKPAKHCYANKFTLNVKVANAGKGRKVHVYRDGHKVRSTGKRKFTIKLNVRKLKPGVHKLRLKVKGADGKWRTRTIKFRRC
jgi:hypothetical protein